LVTRGPLPVGESIHMNIRRNFPHSGIYRRAPRNTMRIYLSQSDHRDIVLRSPGRAGLTYTDNTVGLNSHSGYPPDPGFHGCNSQ